LNEFQINPAAAFPIGTVVDGTAEPNSGLPQGRPGGGPGGHQDG
jgi:hypothetical protein